MFSLQPRLLYSNNFFVIIILYSCKNKDQGSRLMVKQRTLKHVVEATGTSLHHGEVVKISIVPAPVNTGIIFVCSNVAGKMVEIPALAHFVGKTVLNTTLVKDDIEIGTIEHLLSALAGLGIDNAYIHVNNACEMPIMDGSASPFVFLLQSAGICEQDAPKRFIRIKKTVKMTQDDKYAYFKPYNGFKVEMSIDFGDHPVFNSMSKRACLDFSSLSYVKTISRARTFGFISDLEALQKQGLAKGASLDNAIGIDKYRILNADGLRYEDEFVKHKILDAVGDLYLLGASVIGHFVGHKSGHHLNNLLLRKLLAEQDAWEYVSFEDKAKAPISFFTEQFAS